MEVNIYYVGFWILKIKCTQYGYMNKWPSSLQGKFYFLKLGGAGREHGPHLGSEVGVLEAGPNLGHMLSSSGPPRLDIWEGFIGRATKLAMGELGINNQLTLGTCLPI